MMIMKRINTLCCFAFLTLLHAVGAGILKEGFEGPVFPPAGWTNHTSGSGIGGWSRVGDASGYYASCYVTCNKVDSYYSAALWSPAESLMTGDIISLSFDVRNTHGGNWEPLVVTLSSSNKYVWIQFINPPENKPKHFSYILPPIAESGTYYFSWETEAEYPSLYGPLPSGYDIDNVVISRNMGNSLTQVSPSSLGRIKSVYR
jgi:hypothetical protein